MKRIVLFIFSLLYFANISNAQTTAMQLNGMDCNGIYHDLFTDLDSGKAAVIFFYMSNCASCPPVAKKVQTMAANMLKAYPGKIKGYAMPYENNTDCNYSASWVNDNGLPLFVPFVNGKSQVAYYGGFGMPSVVLVGGKDRKVLFFTKSFATKDTLTMRNMLLELFNPSSVEQLPSTVSEFKVFPNPTSDFVSIKLDLNEATDVLIDIADLNGKQVTSITNETISGSFVKQIPTFSLANGTYIVRLKVGDKTSVQNLTILR